MKKCFSLFCATLALSVVLSACGGSPATTPAPTKSSAPTTSQAPSPSAPAPSSAPSGGDTAAEGTLQSPFIVTTCGQSPGAVMLNMVATQAKLTSLNDNTMTAETFSAGDYKTLIVTTGTSMKGMGAAGTDVNAEIDRCVALIQAAKDAGLTIVGAHVEGMARRTDSSDTASIEAVMALSDVILVTEDSDSDGFFTKYAEENSKPLIKVKDTLAIAEVMK